MTTQQVKCAECGTQFEAEQGEAEVSRTPCPNCASTGRALGHVINDLLVVQDAESMDVDRGVNPERLGAFGLFLSIGVGVGLTVGFETDRIALGSVAFLPSVTASVLLLALVVRVDPMRRKVMALMHWATRQ